MNFKKYFYKDYFEREFTIREGNTNRQRRVNLEKPADENEFKRIKKDNKPVFDNANDLLINTTVTQNELNLLNLSGIPNKQLSISTIYPGLLIGTGYNHETNNEAEFKLGFYFDHTTGLPCLPGSSVKGVLRSAFPKLRTDKANPFSAIKPASEIQESKCNYITNLFGLGNERDIKRALLLLELAVFEGIDISACQHLFAEGREDKVEYQSIYNRVIFHHACISRAANNKIFDIDTITPHHENPLKSPTPLNFLKIRPGVEFTFNFSIPEEISGTGISSELILSAFRTILKDLGAGAKTNVGYGQFQ